MVIDMNLSYFQKINNAYGTNNLRDVDLYEIKNAISSSFEDTIDYQVITKRDNTTQGLIIVKQKNVDKKSIKAKPSQSFNLGDIFKWNGLDWLVIEKDSDCKIYNTGTIQQCNYILPFQNDTSDIFQEPCIVTSVQNTDGVDENKVLTLPNDIRTVKVQYNDNTKKLCEDKRIILDMVRDKVMVYRITNIDTVTGMDGEHGLWILTCKADGSYSDTTDNKTLRTCNYISPSTPTPPPTPTTSGSSFVAHNNGNLYVPTDVCSLREGGTPMPFTAVFKDTSGNVLIGLTPTWTITNLNGITNADISITYDLINYPMRVYVQIASNTALIGATFKLHLVDSGNTLGSYDVNCKVVSFS